MLPKLSAFCYKQTFTLLEFWRHRAFILPVFHKFSVRTTTTQSVQRLATGWTVRGPSPCVGHILRTRSDRPWGPPIPLYSGYWVSFPGVKAAVEWRWPHGPSSSAHVKERVKLYTYFPSGLSWPVRRWTYLYLYHNILRLWNQLCVLYWKFTVMFCAHSRIVASGEFFVSPSDPFKSSYGFRRRLRVWTLSLTTRNDTHAPITHPFLGRIFCLPRCLLTLSWGLMIETFHEDSHCRACIFLGGSGGGFVTIFVSASVPNTPCDVTCRPSFDAI